MRRTLYTRDGHMFANSHIARLLIGLAVATGVTSFCAIRYQLARCRTSDTILLNIDRLVLQPPPDISELEWAVYIYWTHNLHANAMPHQSASLSSLRQLNHDLEQSISTGPDLRIVNDLWDRYSAMSESGFEYRQKHEPIRDSVVKAIASQGEQYFDHRSYQDFLARVRSYAP